MTATLTHSPALVKGGFVLSMPRDLGDDAAQGMLDAYYGDSEALLVLVHGPEGIHNSRAKIVAGAMDMTVRELQKAGKALVDLKSKLEVKLLELKWRKYSLIPLMLPAAKEAAADAADAFEASIAIQIDDLAVVGITPETMDAGKLGNMEAAKIQLRHHVLKSEPVLAHQCQKNEAETAVRVLESQFNPPTPTQCRIPWEPLTGFAAKMADLAGLLAEPPAPFMTFNSFRERQLAIELGLEGAALLPKMHETLTALADLLPRDHSRPLTRIVEQHLDKARKLVAKLPPTREAQKFLSATKNGVAAHAL